MIWKIWQSTNIACDWQNKLMLETYTAGGTHADLDQELKTERPSMTGCQFAQAACANGFFFALALAHTAGVNSWIRVILAAGKRVNKSFRQSNGLTREPGDLDVAQILSEFVPLTKLMAEQITGLRNWAGVRAEGKTTL